MSDFHFLLNEFCEHLKITEDSSGAILSNAANVMATELDLHPGGRAVPASKADLQDYVASGLRRCRGLTIINVFSALQGSAEIHLHEKAKLRWFASWPEYARFGNWITSPDSLDYAEMISRTEEVLGLDVNCGQDLGDTVGETVKHLWQRLCTSAKVAE